MSPSSSSSPLVTRRGRLVQTMRRHPLCFYFLMAFAFSWAYEVIVFFPQGSLEDLLVAAPLAFVGPTLSTIIMTALTGGKPGMRRLLRRYVLGGVGFRWYLLTLLALPTLLLLGYLVMPGAIAAFGAIPAAAFLQSYSLSFLVNFTVGGPLGEEPGWRGFALPRLQRGYGPLVGTLILGVLWGLWHLPLFLLVPGFDGAGTDFVGILFPFLALVIEATASAVIFTWVFNHVRGSLLLMMVLHATLNTATSTLPTLFPTFPSSFWLPLTPLLVAVAALLIMVTRGRLSYQRYQQEAEFLDLPAPMEQNPSLPCTAV
jgi:uncharacterized protein